jgi:hypothetical protein
MPDSAILSKVASLLVAGLYASLAFVGVFPHNAIGVIAGTIFLSLPLIWFSESISRWRAFAGIATGRRAEPSFMIAFTGWAILVILPPAVAWLYMQTPDVKIMPH